MLYHVSEKLIWSFCEMNEENLVLVLSMIEGKGIGGGRGSSGGGRGSGGYKGGSSSNSRGGSYGSNVGKP